MDPKDRIRIQKNLKRLVDDLLVQDVIPLLIQEGILSLNDSEIIQHEITKRDQAFKLVQIVITRGPKAYNAFRKSLLESYEHVVDVLDKTDITAEDMYTLDVHELKVSSNDALNLIRDELRTQYLAQLYCINPVPWLDCFQVDLEKVYTSLKIVRGINRSAFHTAVYEEQKYDYTVNTADIFRASDECANPRRILIEGEPGIGKSVMCCKLCYDWAKDGTSEEHSIHKFDIIFIVKARELEVRTPVLDSIYQTLLPEDFSISKKDFKDCIIKNARKTLIIVDGYDELKEQHMDLSKIIQGKILSQVSILLTSRPGFALNMMKHFDSVFVNIGYDEQRRMEFIDKFCCVLNYEESRQAFIDFKSRLKADSVFSELCRNPLNLSILCMLVGESENELPKTRTALYEELKSFIVHRASVTLQIDVDTLEEKCKPLEVIAYQGLLQGTQQVSESEIKNMCSVELLQHLGFFCKEVTVSRFKHVTTFAFTHKSFQEYFAAKFMAKASRTRQERKDMVKEILQLGSCRLVMVFLCGLLKEKSEYLMDVFEMLKSETYLPDVPCEELGLHDANENHRGHLIFHCLNEVSPLPAKLGPRMLNLLVEQVSFSIPFCSDECIDGLLKFCELSDEHCRYCKLMKDMCVSVNTLNIDKDHKKSNGSFLSNNNTIEYKSQQESVAMTKSGPSLPHRPKSLKLQKKPSFDNGSSSPRPMKKSPQMAWAEKKQLKSLDSEQQEMSFEVMSMKDELNMNRRKSEQTWRDSSRQGQSKSKSVDLLDDTSEGKLTPVSEELSASAAIRPKSKSNEAVMNRSSLRRVAGIRRLNVCNKFSVTIPGPFITERTAMFEKILVRILTFKHVHSFGVHNITTVSQLQELLKTLAKVGRPRMTSLKLKFLGVFSESGKIKLNPVYFHWIQSLTILECSSPNILEQLIQNIPSANTIRYLTFQYCTFSETALDALTIKLQNMKALKKFEFVHNSVEKNDHVSIASLLAALENHNRIGYFAISHLPTRIEKLKDSKLDTIFPRKDETSHYFTPHLGKIIQKNELLALNISNTNLGEGILQVIANNLEVSRSVDTLQLRYCHLLDHNCMDNILRNAMNANLKELDFKETELSMENFELLSLLLMKTHILTRLVLSVYNSAAVITLAKGLTLNRSLSDLLLSKVLFNDGNLEPLASAISRHPNLKVLHISSNDMIPLGVSLLFNALRAANTLNHVSLHNFGFEDIHMIELAKVLGVNSNIAELDLQKNFIGPGGADHLYKALCLRDKLLCMNLCDNRAKEHHNEVQLLKTRVLYLKVNWF